MHLTTQLAAAHTRDPIVNFVRQQLTRARAAPSSSVQRRFETWQVRSSSKNMNHVPWGGRALSFPSPSWTTVALAALGGSVPGLPRARETRDFEDCTLETRALPQLDRPPTGANFGFFSYSVQFFQLKVSSARVCSLWSVSRILLVSTTTTTIPVGRAQLLGFKSLVWRTPDRIAEQLVDLYFFIVFRNIKY